jgi:hypothetical protein
MTSGHEIITLTGIKKRFQLANGEALWAREQESLRRGRRLEMRNLR